MNACAAPPQCSHRQRQTAEAGWRVLHHPESKAIFLPAMHGREFSLVFFPIAICVRPGAGTAFAESARTTFMVVLDLDREASREMRGLTKIMGE